MSEELSVLNKQAIAAAKHYMGHTAWLTVIMTFAIAIAFVTTLAFYAQGELSWLASLGLLAALSYMSYTPLHESVHNNIHGNQERLKWLNDLCGYLAAPMIAVPFTGHKVEHFTHHRYTNIEGKDPDFVMHEMQDGVWPAFKVIWKFYATQFTFFAETYWGKATTKERAIFVSEIVFSYGWRILFALWLGSWAAAALLLLAWFFGGTFTMYWFAYRPHHPYNEQKRYRNTSSLIMPTWMKPIEWFWLGQNIHSIHHLFPRVPFYKYHALHKDIEPIMRAHGTPIIDIFSRQPIPENLEKLATARG